MTEAQWTHKIVDELRQCNALVFAAVGGAMQQPGWPDRFVAHTCWSGWLEFKGEKTRTSKKQRYVLRELRSRDKGLAYVVRNPDRIEDEHDNLFSHFDGTGFDLLLRLAELSRYPAR